jgi:ABC-2 type transport system permease protein
MTSPSYALRDSVTMLRRDILHARRFPLMTISSMAVPIFFLLLFVGVFGNALRAGLDGAIAAGGHYVDYLAPGIILMTASSSAESTAVNVSTDMTEGIIARFRTMAIARASVLSGQVLGSMIRSLISVALVVAIAVGLGFRPTASPVEWVAAVGVFLMLSLTFTWLAVAFGLLADTPAGANSLSLILVVLPFVSSAFAPTSTMPAGVRWFAHNQPFTPIIETLRGLLTGTPIGHSAALAAGWCAALAVLGYTCARNRYERTRASLS